MRPRSGLVALALLFALPSVAWACPVCMAVRDEAERLALIGTTVFLTALPVVMIGGIIIWIARRARDLERSEFDAESEPGRGSEAPTREVIPLRSGRAQPTLER